MQITEDDFEELEFIPGGEHDARSRRIAATALEWAEHPDRFHIVPPLRVAHMLIVAAEHLEMVGELDEALAVAERAAAHPSSEPQEALPTIVGIRLTRGDVATVETLLDAYRRSGEVTGPVAAQLTDALEASPMGAGDDVVLRLIERWASIAIRAIEDTGDGDYLLRSVFGARYRARRERGLGLDGLDEEFLEGVEELDVEFDG